MPWVLDPDDGVITVTKEQPRPSRPRPSSPPTGTGVALDPHRRAARRASTRSRRVTWPTSSLDTRDSFAEVLVPALLGVPLEASEVDPDTDDLLEFTREARDLLRGWDFTTPAGLRRSAPPPPTTTRCRHLPAEPPLRRRLARRTQGRRRPLALGRPYFFGNLKSAQDNKAFTPNVTEGKDEVLRQAFVEARLEPDLFEQGPFDRWQWGKPPPAQSRAPRARERLDAGPGPWLVNEGPEDLPGGSAIVNANGWNASEGYEVDCLSMRMVVDLANLDGST